MQILSTASNRRRAARLVLLLGLMVGLAACASTETPPSSDVSIGATASAVPTPQMTILDDLSATERAILKDKRVSPAELKRSGQEFEDCLIRAGMAIVDRDPDDPGPDGITYSFDASVEDKTSSRPSEKSTQDCHEGVDAVGEVWTLQQEVSDVKRSRAINAFIECLRATGMDLPPDAKLQDAYPAALKQSAKADVRGCIDAVDPALTTGLPGLREALARLDIG